MSKVYILGGAQTDFARHWSREGHTLFEILKEAVLQAFVQNDVPHDALESAHVGNFVGELFTGQGHLGGLFASIDPVFEGIATGRHEAACASGSIAIQAACAEIEAGRYDLVCASGVEQMRNVPGQQAADYLGAAAWVGQEGQDATYLWPAMFSDLADAYDQRYGLHYPHLMKLAETHFANARHNPQAQTRRWNFPEGCFAQDDALNPVVEGRIRRLDCGQVTDGAAAVLLASERYAAQYATQKGLSLAQLPYIKGWGHRSSHLRQDRKLEASQDQVYLLPHVAQTFQDALQRAGLDSAAQLDGIELHDCFSITGYMLLDHLGFAAPGQIGALIADGYFTKEGSFPVNPSGGLIGLGHPVGATGVRMLLDAARQVSGQAGDTQIADAQTFATFNIGGSTTTCVSFIVHREAA